MTSSLSAELAATCNALGYFDPKTNKYYADSNTLETVKDLIRYLRRDDESHDIRRHLGETQVLQADLLPLLKSYWEETDLFDVLLRLLVNLTSPALMLWHEELPTEKSARNHYLQIEDHLQKYKQAFADEAVWAVLSTRLSKILETDFSERGEENSLIIERILILIRNVLHVPANPDAEKRPDNDASVHDQVLWALHQSGMLDIILFITSSTTEQAYYMHALEILSFMFREQSASELAHAALQRSQTEKMRDEAELLAIRHRETNQKQQKIKMYNGARHSRFGGTFVVKSMKSISDNELIYHKPLNRLDALNFDVEKKKPKTPKNRLPVQGTSSERRSAFSIRLFLKEFCIEFLNGAYNTLMYHVKDNLVRAKAQAHDESYYLWALRFFMEFNRCYKFEVKLVSETMTIHSFHFVQQQMEKYFDMLNTDKKKIPLWSRRLHLALLAYRELLLSICAMDKCPDGSVRDSAKVIKSNIFYVIEYRELILTLLITYNELILSNLYLNDLIETQHIFMRMFQSYCEKNGDVVVQKKAKARKKKRKAAAASAVTVPEMNLETMWDEAAPQLSTVLEGASNIPTDVVPFDAASDVPIDEQKSEAMKNIQRGLRNNEFENALGLLRAAREVWPENDSFGNSTMAPEEELLALRDIFFADFGENILPNPQPQQEEDDEDDEEEDEEEEVWDAVETDFKFSSFANRLAHPRIVRACGLALRNFEHNSVQTNHCIAKLLHRIAWDAKMYTTIFQASIFRTFQKIYASKSMPQFKELAKFATYVIRQFFKLAETNPKVFMEALFWKSSRDAYEIDHGYGTFQASSKAAAHTWSEIQEDELRRLFMEHQEKKITEDVGDWIVNNLIDNTRTRRAVIKKLKEMCLLTKEYKRPGKSGISGRAPRQWGEDEEEQLRELYEQFKDAMDPLGCIMDRLDVPRPRNRIVEKLLVMGLIQDKKEVRKKRAKKSRGSGGQRFLDAQNSQSEDDTDSDGNQRGRTNKTSRRAFQAAAPIPVIKQLLKNVAAMTDALEWLKDNFSDMIEDMEDGLDESDEGVPLVTIMDCAIQAMENENFKKLLRSFGIKEPDNEQEMYWRIPGHLSVATLRQYCQLIADTLPGENDTEAVGTVHSDNANVSNRVMPIANPPSNALKQRSSSRGIRSGSKNINVPSKHLLKKVAGMTEALEWLKDSFSDMLEDMEDGQDQSDEGVPLVTIMDCAVQAMENENFKKLLRSFGIKKPSDEQEMYWRIPGNLSAGTIRQYCQLITETLSGENNPESADTMHLDNEDVSTRIRQIVDQSSNALEQHLNSRGIHSGSESDTAANVNPKQTDNKRKPNKKVPGVSRSKPKNIDIDSNNQSNTPKSKEKKRKQKKKIAILNSDDDSDAGNSISKSNEKAAKGTNSKNQNNPSKSKKRIVVVDSDDDADENFRVFEELPIDNAAETVETHTPKGRNRILDSDTEGECSEKENVNFPADNNKRHHDFSDSEVQTKKKTRVLVSDEEDEI